MKTRTLSMLIALPLAVGQRCCQITRNNAPLTLKTGTAT